MDDRAEVSIRRGDDPARRIGHVLALDHQHWDASGPYIAGRSSAEADRHRAGRQRLKTSGSQIRKAIARAMGELSVAPSPLPVEWARHRIAESRKLNAVSRQVLPLGLEACTELIEPRRPVRAPARRARRGDHDRAGDVGDGLGGAPPEPEMRAWLRSSALGEMLQKVGERLGARTA
jgi:hypothetical protein